MVPAKLSRQSTTNHNHLWNKKIDSFQRLLDSRNKQRKFVDKKVTVGQKTQEASHLVAELTA
jgi:hypothetical protein